METSGTCETEERFRSTARAGPTGSSGTSSHAWQLCRHVCRSSAAAVRFRFQDGTHSRRSESSRLPEFRQPSLSLGASWPLHYSRSCATGSLESVFRLTGWRGHIPQRVWPVMDCDARSTFPGAVAPRNEPQPPCEAECGREPRLHRRWVREFGVRQHVRTSTAALLVSAGPLA